MGGGGGGNTQTVTKADPWPGVQPYLTNLFANAQGNYDSGGPQYYPNSTVAPMSGITNLSLGLGADRALNGSPVGNAAQQQGQNTLNGAYFGSDPSTGVYNAYGNGSQAGMNPAQGVYNGYAGGANMGTNPAQGIYNSYAAGDKAGMNPASGYFNAATNGQYVGSNPYLSSMVGAATHDIAQNYNQTVAPTIASQFSLGGRYGSGAQGAALAQGAQPLASALQNATTNIYGNAYSQERGLQQAAAGQLANLGQQDVQNQMAGAAGLANVRQQDVQNQLAGASGLANIHQQDVLNQMTGVQGLSGAYQSERQRQQSAMGLAPSLANMDYTNLNALTGIGQSQEGYAQQQITDAMNRWNYQQNLPNQNLTNLSALLQGGIGAGQQKSVDQSTSKNPFSSAVGGGMAGYALGNAAAEGIGGMMGGATTGSNLGIYGALAGAVLGGLFG